MRGRCLRRREIPDIEQLPFSPPLFLAKNEGDFGPWALEVGESHLVAATFQKDFAANGLLLVCVIVTNN